MFVLKITSQCTEPGGTDTHWPPQLKKGDITLKNEHTQQSSLNSICEYKNKQLQ